MIEIIVDIKGYRMGFFWNTRVLAFMHGSPRKICARISIGENFVPSTVQSLPVCLCSRYARVIFFFFFFMYDIFQRRVKINADHLDGFARWISPFKTENDAQVFQERSEFDRIRSNSHTRIYKIYVQKKRWNVQEYKIWLRAWIWKVKESSSENVIWKNARMTIEEEREREREKEKECI